MDGCAKTGKPDSDDWVRTCAAQNGKGLDVFMLGSDNAL
jgi:hypothetical protein